MRKPSLFAGLLALCLTLSACGAPAAEGGISYAPDEARRLTVYTSHKEEVYRPIVREFEARTGIWVEVVAGGTNELLQRLAAEAETPQCDVMFGGGVESLEAYRALFLPYTCAGAEQLQEAFRAEDDCWTPFSALPVVLIRNRKLVEPDEVTRWRDLFDEAYRGRIAFTDPAISGSSFTALSTLLSAVGGDEGETMARFAHALAGKQLTSSAAVVTEVEKGSLLLGVTLEETARQRIAAGADIAIVYPADGTSCVPDGTAVIRGCAHEENARRFVDFTVSADVQEMLSANRRSVRRDVAPAADMPELRDLPLTDYDIPTVSARRDALLRAWAEAVQTEAGA